MTAPTIAEPTTGAESSPTPDSGEVTVRRRRRERGQGMVEYALILALIAAVVIVAVQMLGHGTTSLYSNIENGVQVATGG